MTYDNYKSNKSSFNEYKLYPGTRVLYSKAFRTKVNANFKKKANDITRCKFESWSNRERKNYE